MPLDSLDDLETLEALFKADPNKIKQMTGYLRLIDGKSASDATRRILASVFGSELAVLLNYAGRGSKIGIKDMAITDIIYGAVRGNKVFQNATRVEVDNTIKLWLRNAADRNGGRSNRKCYRPRVQISETEQI